MKITNPAVQPPKGDSKMKTNLVEMQDGIPTTTSLIVGQEFDKDHRNVLRDIERLISEMEACTEGFNALNSEPVDENTTGAPTVNKIVNGDYSTKPATSDTVTSPKFMTGDYSDKSVTSDTVTSAKIITGDYSDKPVVGSYFIKSMYLDAKNEFRPMYIITEEGFALLAMGFTGQKALVYKLRFLNEFKRLVVENQRLQAENFTLLENKTKLLESKVKAFDAKTFEIRDRNSYLEKKRALFIDDHIIKEVTQAYEEATRELRETQDLMYSREWAEGTTKPLAKCLQKLIMARMRNILRVTKNLRKFFKGSELETEYLLNRYIDEIEVEAKHLQW